MGLLATATELITEGVPAKIQSAGFDARSPAMPSPLEPVAVIEGMKVVSDLPRAVPAEPARGHGVPLPR